jgi:hypothetical protein
MVQLTCVYTYRHVQLCAGFCSQWGKTRGHSGVYPRDSIADSSTSGLLLQNTQGPYELLTSEKPTYHSYAGAPGDSHQPSATAIEALTKQQRQPKADNACEDRQDLPASCMATSHNTQIVLPTEHASRKYHVIVAQGTTSTGEHVYMEWQMRIFHYWCVAHFVLAFAWYQQCCRKDCWLV